MDANYFYSNNRSINAPITEYLHLDRLSLVNNSLTICNMNIRSIPKNLQLFKDSVLHDSAVNFDVLGFTETRLQPHLSSLYEIPGYNMFINSRNVHGGGVALYISNNFDSSEQTQLTVSDHFIETIAVEMSIKRKKYLFICIYRPQSSNLKQFLLCFE